MDTSLDLPIPQETQTLYLEYKSKLNELTSNYQDSVAEKKSLIETYKSKLTQLTQLNAK